MEIEEQKTKKKKLQFEWIFLCAHDEGIFFAEWVLKSISGIPRHSHIMWNDFFLSACLKNV